MHFIPLGTIALLAIFSSVLSRVSIFTTPLRIREQMVVLVVFGGTKEKGGGRRVRVVVVRVFLYCFGHESIDR